MKMMLNLKIKIILIMMSSLLILPVTPSQVLINVYFIVFVYFAFKVFYGFFLSVSDKIYLLVNFVYHLRNIITNSIEIKEIHLLDVIKFLHSIVDTIYTITFLRSYLVSFFFFKNFSVTKVKSSLRVPFNNPTITLIYYFLLT
jgi:hypothetical protein